MNTLVSKNPNSQLDIMTDVFWEYLKAVFPNMSDKVMFKNKWFYRLLNDYRWRTINWIDRFLSENWYISEWNKLINNFEDITNKLTDNEKKQILEWNLLIWTKLFIYENKSWDFDDMNYLVLASKKDNPVSRKLREFFQNMLIWILWAKWNIKN